LLAMVLVIIDDYFKRKKLADKIKVGDKPRLFTEDEVTFERLEVMEIYKNEKGKRIAKCKHENGDIYEYHCSDLIY